MRKHCRTASRTRGKRVLSAATTMVKLFHYVQPVGSTWKDWEFHTVSLKQAQRLVSLGEAETVTRLVDGEVQVAGYKALTPVRESRPSQTSLTYGTLKAVGNAVGKGVRLTRGEWRHIEKFVAWPLIGDHKNLATVRPRISEAESKRANAMLQRGYLKAA